MINHVTISVDGSCYVNPGPGGYAAVLRVGENTKEISGYVRTATNQQMELTALIAGCSVLKCPCEIEVRYDSTYIVNSFQKLDEYKKTRFINEKGKLIPNAGLLVELDKLRQKHTFKFTKVKAHSGDKDNERCDELAKKEWQKGFPFWECVEKLEG